MSLLGKKSTEQSCERLVRSRWVQVTSGHRAGEVGENRPEIPEVRF